MAEPERPTETASAEDAEVAMRASRPSGAERAEAVVSRDPDETAPETAPMPGAPAKPEESPAVAAAAKAASGHQVAARTSQPRASAAQRASSSGAEGGALGAYEAVARSAKLPDLVSLTLEVVGGAAAARRADVASPSKVQNVVELSHFVRADAETPYGNALKVLEHGPEGAAERALAQALWAHAVAEAPRSRTEDEDRLVADLLWLATHTPYDATPLLDRALGDDAADLWKAIADRVRRIDDGRGAALGRAEAVVGCAALAGSTSKAAADLRTVLAGQLRDPVLVHVLGAGAREEASELRLAAQLVATPRGPVATTLLAVTGILFVLRAAAIIGRLALAYRTPTEVSLSNAGIRVRTRIEMLGRTLREREQIIPRESLVRVVREVRYPRAAFYAGLLALVVGSWIGVRALVDGVRAASPSLLLVGLVIVALGVAADFVLGSILPGSRGRCRLAFVPKSGHTVWIGDVDARRADEVLARVLRG